MWTAIVIFDLILIILILILTIVSLTRVLMMIRKHYIYQYNLYKFQFIGIAICIIVSFGILLGENINVLNNINALVYNTPPLYAQTKFGSIVIFVGCNIPSLAFVILNSPNDFMIDFNKYPESFKTVSIIQYSRFHMFYDCSLIFKFVHPHKNRGPLGTRLLRSPKNLRSTSFIKAEKLIKDSEIMERLAGTLLPYSTVPDSESSGLTLSQS